MKNNKITRKIKKLEMLNVLIENIQRIVEDSEETLEYYNERLSEAVKEESEYEITRCQNTLEDYTIKLDEAKKLIAEIEKMA